MQEECAVEWQDGSTWIIAWESQFGRYFAQRWFPENLGLDTVEDVEEIACPGPEEGLFATLEVLEVAMGQPILTRSVPCFPSASAPSLFRTPTRRRGTSSPAPSTELEPTARSSRRSLRRGPRIPTLRSGISTTAAATDEPSIVPPGAGTRRRPPPSGPVVPSRASYRGPRLIYRGLTAA